MNRLVLISVMGVMMASPAMATTVIRSETSSSAETGRNTGSGDIGTGDAKATSRSEVKSSDENTEVKASAIAETDDGKAEVSVETDEGNVLIERSESAGGAEATASVRTESPDRTAAEEGRPQGIIEKIKDFILSLFR